MTGKWSKPCQQRKMASKWLRKDPPLALALNYMPKWSLSLGGPLHFPSLPMAAHYAAQQSRTLGQVSVSHQTSVYSRRTVKDRSCQVGRGASGKDRRKKIHEIQFLLQGFFFFKRGGADFFFFSGFFFFWWLVLDSSLVLDFF